MSGKAKNFLVILEINNLLFHLNNPRFKKFDSHVNRIPINYQDKYNNIDISYRKGKNQFLTNLFINLKDDIDVAVWSNLGNDLTNDLCHKYFTRYYRNLLFILATNRGLYGDHPEHTPIKVRKDLEAVYSRFQGYQNTNTVVVSVERNLTEKHSRNDLIVPQYSPFNPEFSIDPGLSPLSKYLQGLVMLKKQSGIGDITRFINAKEAKNIFKRAAHHLSTDP